MSFTAGLIFVCVLLVASASVQGAIVGRIYGGEEANFEQFPYQVSVRYSASHKCGGSILSERFVLTAAHCVVEEGIKPFPVMYISVKAGSNNRVSGGVVARVKAINVNQNYDGDTFSDVALLELEKPLSFSSRIQPIELGTEEVPVGSDIIISGWGLRKDDENVPNKLHHTILKATGELKCLGPNTLSVLESLGHLGALMCLGHEVDNGACSGDSGGPAVYNNKLVGVAGFVVPDCGTTTPDGFAKVSYHAEWIKSLMV